MNLDEMKDQLPNGLHDAEIESIVYDLPRSTLTMQLRVWVGTMDDPSELREMYRRGELCFQATKFFGKSVPYDASDDRLTILTFDQNDNLKSEFKASPPVSGSGFRILTGNCELDIEAGILEFKWIEANTVNRDDEVYSA